MPVYRGFGLYMDEVGVPPRRLMEEDYLCLIDEALDKKDSEWFESLQSRMRGEEVDANH